MFGTSVLRGNPSEFKHNSFSCKMSKSQTISQDSNTAAHLQSLYTAKHQTKVKTGLLWSKRLLILKRFHLRLQRKQKNVYKQRQCNKFGYSLSVFLYLLVSAWRYQTSLHYTASLQHVWNNRPVIPASANTSAREAQAICTVRCSTFVAELKPKVRRKELLQWDRSMRHELQG